MNNNINPVNFAPLIASGTGLFLRYLLSCTGFIFPTRMTTKEIFAGIVSSIILIVGFKCIAVPMLKEHISSLEDQLVQFAIEGFIGLFCLEILPRVKTWLEKEADKRGFNVPDKSNNGQTS